MTMSDADWLEEAARYFEKRPTGGEDMAFWANVSNAERCRSIATALRASSGVEVKGLEWERVSEYRLEADDYTILIESQGCALYWREKHICQHKATELAKAAAEADYRQRILSCISSPLPTVEVTEEGKFPSLKDAYAAAVKAAQTFDDAANVEETNWSGWGEQTVPPYATMRRVKAGQAVAALRDADPAMFAALSQNKGEE